MKEPHHASVCFVGLPAFGLAIDNRIGSAVAGNGTQESRPKRSGVDHAGDVGSEWLSRPRGDGSGNGGSTMPPGETPGNSAGDEDKIKVNGRIALTLPADVPLGNHRIAVYDADGDLIGWQGVKIAKPTAGGVSVTPVSGSAGLPDTGGPSIALAPIGLLITLAGGALVMVSRRRREM